MMSWSFRSLMRIVGSRRASSNSRSMARRVEACSRSIPLIRRSQSWRSFGISGHRFEDALEIARKVIELFQKAEIDAVYLVGNNFKSMMASLLVTTRLLPVELPEKQEQIDYIYEQPPGELLAALLPRYIESQIYRAMLESDAAQHAARMTAMEAASSNASDVISSLTLRMNRVRQASITREIIEIVSGAAALD